MQKHNHRMPMNTRISNRFSISKLKQDTGPIPACDHVGIGSPYDTYEFMATSEFMGIVMISRNGTAGLPNTRNPTVTNGELWQQAGSLFSQNLGTPFVRSFIVKCKLGEKVSLKMDRPPDGRILMDKWTMVYAVGTTHTPNLSPLASQNTYAQVMTPATSAVTSSVESTSVSRKVFFVAVNTAATRGRIVLSSSRPQLKLDAEICNNLSLDPVSLNPDEPTGGYYSASFWTYNKASSAGFIYASWNKYDGINEKYAGTGQAQIVLQEGFEFTGLSTVTVIPE